MARTRTAGRLLTSATATSAVPARGAGPVDADFAATWNGLDKEQRRQIRRLVRIGRPQETAADAELASGFAAYQRTRSWYRRFWLWFVPLTVAGLVAGVNIHPLVIGLVLGAAASAYAARRNFRRTDAVNAGLLAGDVVPAAA